MVQLNSARWLLLLVLAMLVTVPVFAVTEPQANRDVTTSALEIAQTEEQAANAHEKSATKTGTVSGVNQTEINLKPKFTFPKPAFNISGISSGPKNLHVKSSDNDVNDGQQAAANAQASAANQESLRKAALNPIASLISVPVQNNMNFATGPNNDRIQNVLNIQPVIPVKLSPNWNMIIRAITPIIYQPDTTTETNGAFGLGDMNPSFFFSPAKASKLIWGVGPTFILPTATSHTLGQGKLQIGPTFVLLVQPGKWTLGSLFNNTWSVAGQSDRPATNQGYFQSFINYNLNQGYYLTWQPTITFNWKAEGANRWLVPFGGGIGRIMKLGQQPVNIGIQAFANPIRQPNSSPFSLRLQLVFLYPKK